MSTEDKIDYCVYCKKSITKYEGKMAVDNWGGFAHRMCWYENEFPEGLRLGQS